MTKSETKINTDLKPFLKWAGGKRWFIVNHKDIIPRFEGKYLEPFLGGGAVFFHLKPSKGIIADINEDLIITYKSLQKDHIKVSKELNLLKDNKIDYYEVRSWEPKDEFQIASRFIYLNRTCWNGLFRVNQDGKFNVPKGTKLIEKYPEDDFSGLATALKRVIIHHRNFKQTIGYARKGDFIFADPPYTVRHNNNGFIKYNEHIFSWKDQVELSESLSKAVLRGCKVICTNANHQSIRNLYSNGLFKLNEVSRYSSISSKSNTRNKYQELIIQSK